MLIKMNDGKVEVDGAILESTFSPSAQWYYYEVRLSKIAYIIQFDKQGVPTAGSSMSNHDTQLDIVFPLKIVRKGATKRDTHKVSILYKVIVKSTHVIAKYRVGMLEGSSTVVMDRNEEQTMRIYRKNYIRRYL